MAKIYLVGAIESVTMEEAYGWRQQATQLLTLADIEVINPYRWDFRFYDDSIRTNPSTREFNQLVVNMSERAVDEADALLCRVPLKGGWGTPIECYRAQTLQRKPVFGFGVAPNDAINGWIDVNITHKTFSLHDAVDMIVAMYGSHDGLKQFDFRG